MAHNATASSRPRLVLIHGGRYTTPKPQTQTAEPDGVCCCDDWDVYDGFAQCELHPDE